MGSVAVFENPKAFCRAAAMALGGDRPGGDGVTSHVSSEFDPFLNQAFVEDDGDPAEAVRRLAGRPGFVWMASEPTADTQRRMEHEGFVLTSFTAMEAGGDEVDARGDPALVPIRARGEVMAWHAVYSEVLGPDPRSVRDWLRLYDALGPAGDASLGLWLLAANGAPAATAALFIDGHTAGLYCFATRERFRRRGLASALVAVCLRHAHQHGATRCVLQASATGRPVYALAGFEHVESVPVFVRR